MLFLFWNLICFIDGSGFLLISPDNKYIIFGANLGLGKNFKMFDIQTKQEIPVDAKEMGASLTGMAITKDNKYLIYSASDLIRIIDFQTKKKVYSIKDGHDGEVAAVALTKDGEQVVSVSQDKSLKVFNLKSGAEAQHVEEAHDSKYNNLSFLYL